MIKIDKNYNNNKTLTRKQQQNNNKTLTRKQQQNNNGYYYCE
jgi:hypothetical protein